jgi:hypothetical protein
MFSMPIGELISWVAAGLLALLFAYALVRGVSFAYFRTRLEYLREAMKETKKGD